MYGIYENSENSTTLYALHFIQIWCEPKSLTTVITNKKIYLSINKSSVVC